MKKRAWIMGGVVFSLYALMFLLFAPKYTRPATALPPHALGDAQLQRLGTIHVQDLVALRLNRGDLSKPILLGIGALVWLPFLMGTATFLILMLQYRLGPSIFLPAALVLGGVVGIRLSGSVLLGVVIFLFAVGLVLLSAFISSGRGRPSRAIHILIATFCFMSGLSLSWTTDSLLTSYSGFRPASEVDVEILRVLFDNLTHDAVPPGVGDVNSFRIDQIKSLNALSQPVNVFGVNRLAAAAYIITSLLYLLVVWVIIIPGYPKAQRRQLRPIRRALPPSQQPQTVGDNTDDPTTAPATRRSRFSHVLRVLLVQQTVRRDIRLPHAVRVVFAIPFYLSVGVGFAIIFFNIYIAAAAKQNVMLLYADFMQLNDDKYNELVAARESFGPTESIVRRMLAFPRKQSDKDTSATLYAARARYWPSAVIAQELPRVTPSGQAKTQQAVSARVTEPPTVPADLHSAETETREAPASASQTAETQMVLDPQLTFTDMLYFSFVSFTTTGYGDIRPISDELRFWTICENIIEVLFTAMFFVVAMDGKHSGER
jgi:hypothetical protein